MIIGLHHGGVTVVDVALAVDHLQMLSGWSVVHHIESAHPLAVGRDIAGAALLEGPNGFLEVVQSTAPEPARRRTVAEPGITHLSIQLPSMDKKNAQLARAGIERHSEPVELGTGFSYLYVRGPEHNVVEIEGAAHAPAALGSWLSHVGIATPNLGRLREAYESLLGAPALASTRVAGVAELDAVTALSDADVSMSWVPAANANVELIQFHNPPTGEPEHLGIATPAVGHLCFEVDDVAAELDRTRNAGFTAIGVAAGGGIEVGRMKDPDGNLVELVSYERKDDPLSLRNVEAFNLYREMDAILAARSAQ